MVTSTFKTV